MSEENDIKVESYQLPTAVEPSAEAREALSETKSQLMIGIPFLGIMTMTCHYRFSNDIPTACATSVNGKNQIFINEEFFLNGLSGSERVFVLGHEILHIFLEHIGRQMENSYNPQLWNVATDYCINGYLQEIIDADSAAAKYMSLPSMALFNNEYKGKGSDEIYHLLLDQAEQVSLSELADMLGEGSAEGEGWEDAKKKGKQIAIDGVSKEKVSDSLKQENRQTAAASVEMSQQIMKSRGHDQLGIFREIYDLITPKIPWSDILNEYVTETCRREYTYSRPSRRSSGNVVFPSLTGEHISVCFGVDTSGSMSPDELREALSELSGVINQFESWTISLISCDTKAHHIGDYESEEGDDITTIDKKLLGGGGTLLAPLIRHPEEEMEDLPNVTIIVTDGYVDSDEINDAIDEVPVIVLLTSEGANREDVDIPNARVLKMDK